MKSIYYSILIFFIYINSAYSLQSFSFAPEDFGFRGASYGATEFGDFDADGDLDLLVIGEEDIGSRVGIIYVNVGNTFDADSNIVLPYEFVGGDAKWGDYDKDGDLDIFVSGQSGNGRLTTILRNDNGVFKEVDFGFINLQDSAVDWGDIDNDGDMDAVVSGFDFNFDRRLLIYKNSGGGFDLDSDMEGIRVGDLELVDYDLDGDLDLFITGSGESGRISTIYDNTPDGFMASGITFEGVLDAASDWGDYDQDGDLDLILCGNNQGRFSAIYRNDLTGFTEMTAISIIDVEQGDVKWADFDSDGDLDFIINGGSATVDTTIIYENIGSGFVAQDIYFPYLRNSAITVGDYDNDGDMDIAISGRYVNRQTFIVTNYGTSQNTPPGEPINLTHTFDEGAVVLSWDRATDAQSAKAAMSYNLKVGTVPGGSDIMTAHVTPENKFMLSRRGNVEQNLSWPLKDLPLGTYFWSVQSVDNNYAVSQFTPEQSFTVKISPLFTERDIGMPDFQNGDLAWGDYDSDGDLDIAATGFDNDGSSTKSVIFTNGGSGSFADLNASLQNASGGNIEWGDYDRDKDLDLLLSGNSTNTIIYRNDNNTFVNIAAGLPGFNNGDAFWVDYDNDGDLDVHLAPLGELYQNNDNIFSLDEIASANLESVTDADAAWGDYDNDGDKDLIVLGTTGQYYGYLYRNDGGTFTDWEYDFDATDDGQGFGYPNNGYAVADVDWGDYDFDGDLDFIISGAGRSNTADVIRLTVMYENRGPDLTNPGKWLFIQTEETRFENQRRYQGVDRGTVNWGDFGNDGLLDFLVTGSQGTTINQSDYVSSIYTNVGTDTFEMDLAASGTLLGMGNSAAAVGDYDNDSDLDILQFGYSGTSGGLGYATRLYINNISETAVNNPPSIPMNLHHAVVKDTVFLFWDPADDDRTPQPGLTYNVRIGTGPGAQDVLSAHAFSDGKLKITTKGNAESALLYKIVGLPKDQDYFWSVQAIDAGFSGSAFSEEQVFNTFDPSLTILQPNGGENFVSGSNVNIDWEFNNVDLIRLEFSDDLGTSWTTIAQDIPAENQSFFWAVPEIESDQCLIRISSMDDPGLNDQNDTPFSIIGRFTDVIQPNGGEVLFAGDTYKIKWYSSHDSEYRIEYSLDGGTAWVEIGTKQVFAGPDSIDWNVPGNATTEGLIRVSDINNSGVRDTSDAFFSISVESNVVVQSPNGFEVWLVDSTYFVDWFSNYESDFKAEYSTNAGASWTLIGQVDATSGNSSIEWIIPNEPSVQCLVRVTDVNNSAISDQSDDFFSIAIGSSLELISPNGGEKWLAGSMQSISWNSQSVLNINIELSVDNGDNWNTIVSGFSAGNSSYNWLIPNNPSDECLVRITDALQPTVQDISDNAFSILAEGSAFIDLTSPVGGESYEAGSTQNITWSSSGIDNILIDFSVHPDSGYVEIGNESAANQSFQWQVPAVISEFSRIRLRSQADPGIRDSSSTFFTISDNTPPDFSDLNYSEDEDIGIASPVSMVITDNTSIDQVNLFYRQGGAVSFSSVNMVLQNGTGLYSAEIPAFAINEKGASFYIEATDIAGNRNRTDILSISVNLLAGVNNPNPPPAGTSVSNYRIISIPAILENNRPNNFISINTDLGSYDNSKFRWFGFNNVTQQLIEYPDIGDLTPGRGYFFITKNDVVLNSGAGQTLDIESEFSLNVPQGWSLIGNPFNFNIPFDSLFTEPAVEFKLWRFNGDWVLNTQGMSPWEGYALWVSSATTFNIKPGVDGLLKSQPFYNTELNDPNNWLLQLKLKSKNQTSSFNFIGQDEYASDEIDKLDLISPPQIEKQNRILIQNDKLLAADVRSIKNDGHVWEFVCDVNSSERVFTLHVIGIDDIPSEKEIYLMDLRNGHSYNLRNISDQQFMNSNTKENKFQIIVGSKDYFSSLELDGLLLPAKMMLNQNYPNPFNPLTQITYSINKPAQVKIDIFNVLGKKVQTIVNSYRQPGNYTNIWNAGNFGSGIYFIKMSAGNFVEIKRAVLLK